eukprot:CFRG4943T1
MSQEHPQGGREREKEEQDVECTSSSQPALSHEEGSSISSNHSNPLLVACEHIRPILNNSVTPIATDLTDSSNYSSHYQLDGSDVRTTPSLVEKGSSAFETINLVQPESPYKRSRLSLSEPHSHSHVTVLGLSTVQRTVPSLEASITTESNSPSKSKTSAPLFESLQQFRRDSSTSGTRKNSVGYTRRLSRRSTSTLHRPRGTILSTFGGTAIDIDGSEGASTGQHEHEQSLLSNVNSRAISSQNSYSDFQTPTKGAAQSVDDKNDKSLPTHFDPEYITCSICMEYWTGSGEHRLVVTKCGHLFGQKCIEKWLRKDDKKKDGKPGQGSCPSCGTMSNARDLRVVFAPHLISAVDITNVDAMKDKEAQLVEEKKARDKELALVKMKLNQVMSALNSLKAENEILRSREFKNIDRNRPNLSTTTPSNESVLAETPHMEPTNLMYDSPSKGTHSLIEIIQDESSVINIDSNDSPRTRVCESIGVDSMPSPRDNIGDSNVYTHTPSLPTIRGSYKYKLSSIVSADSKAVVLQYSQNKKLFAISNEASAEYSRFCTAKYGFVTTNLEDDMRAKVSIPVHDKIVKDIKFSRTGDVILTASRDKTAKLVSVDMKKVVRTFEMPLDAWSCAWSELDPNYFYIGLMQGKVRTYDIRAPKEHVNEITALHERPVTSIIELPPVRSLDYSSVDQGAEIGHGYSGLLVGTLTGVSFMEKVSSNVYNPIALPIPEGRLLWSTAAPNSRKCVATVRPNSGSAQSRVEHVLFDMDADRGKIDVTMYGGPVANCMPRGTMFQAPGSDPSAEDFFYAIPDERSKAVQVWDVRRKVLRQAIDCNRASRDVKSARDVRHLREKGNEFVAILTSSTLSVHQWSGSG